MTNATVFLDPAATGKNIIRLREAKGLSVKDVQDAFGFMTPQAVYKWQRGTAMPTLDNAVILAGILGCKLDDIFVTRTA